MNKEFHTVRGYQLLVQNKRHLTSAMEDYLEMIYRNSMDVIRMQNDLIMKRDKHLLSIEKQ